MEELCNELQDMAERVVARKPKKYDLLVNIPPGTTKSSIATIVFPPWCWIMDSKLRFITGSYSKEISIEHAIFSRDIIKSEKYQRLFPDIRIRKDKDRKTNYVNTAGGMRTATSVGGAITGKHAHIIIVDDPLNPKEAMSDVERKNANKWLDQTLSSRKVDKSITPTIMIMQRLHDNDCSGHWLKKKDKRLKHICLPARETSYISPAKWADNYEDGLLDTKRLDDNVLKEFKEDMGSYAFAGQMMQSPIPLEGAGIVKPQEFYEGGVDLNFCKCYGYIDLAISKEETADWTAVVTIAKHKDTGRLYVVEPRRLRGSPTEQMELVFELHKRYNYVAFGVESVQYQRAFAEWLRTESARRDQYIPVVEMDVTRDKVTRAMEVSPYIENGTVVFSRGNVDYINELEYFPKGEHDDWVDATVGAIKLATRSSAGGSISARGKINYPESHGKEEENFNFNEWKRSRRRKARYSR